jgi:hypothetical protein
MARGISVTLALVMVVAVVGCGGGSNGGSSTPASTTSSASGSGNGTTGTEAKACVQSGTEDVNACHDSYTACSKIAKAKVRAFKSGKGPNLGVAAGIYAKQTYGSSAVFKAGYVGCLAALLDEYNGTQ